VILDPSQIFVAAMCGLALVVLIAVLRHATAHRWEAGIIIGIFFILAAVPLFNGFVRGSGSISLRAAAYSDPSQVAIAERMLSDSGTFGMGAGTYRALVPIYREADDPRSVFSPPTTATAIAVELGRPALTLFVVLNILSILLLFRRALGRGRDAVYASAGSACALTVCLGLFYDASLTASIVVILTAITLGLGVGQSISLRRG
jgi:hypothetical protein